MLGPSQSTTMSAVGLKAMPMGVMMLCHSHSLNLMEGNVENGVLITSASQDGMSNGSDATSSATLASPHLTPSVTPTHDSGSPDVVPGTPEAGSAGELVKCSFCEGQVAEVTTVFLDDEEKERPLALNACNTCTHSVRSSELLRKLVQDKQMGSEQPPPRVPTPSPPFPQDEDAMPAPIPLSESGVLGNFLQDFENEHLLPLSIDYNSQLYDGHMLDPPIDNNDFNILSQPCEAIFNASVNSNTIATDFSRNVEEISPFDSPMGPRLSDSAGHYVDNAPELDFAQGSKRPVSAHSSPDSLQSVSLSPESSSQHLPKPGSKTSTHQRREAKLDLLNSSARTRGRPENDSSRGRSLLETHLTATGPPGWRPISMGQLHQEEAPSPATEFPNVAAKPNKSRGRKSQRGARSKAGKSPGRGVRGGGVTKASRGGSGGSSRGRSSRGGRSQGGQGRVKQAPAKKGGERKNWSGAAQRGAGGGRASGGSRSAGAARGAGVSGATQPAGDQQKASKMYRCKTCQKTFNNWRDVDLHQKSEECDHGVLICKICEQRFSAPEVLYRHYMTNHHGSV